MDVPPRRWTTSKENPRKYGGSWSLLDGVGRGDGGARRDRTDDLLHAMQALSQLSYGPKIVMLNVECLMFNEKHQRPTCANIYHSTLKIQH